MAEQSRNRQGRNQEDRNRLDGAGQRGSGRYPADDRAEPTFSLDGLEPVDAGTAAPHPGPAQAAADPPDLADELNAIARSYVKARVAALAEPGTPPRRRDRAAAPTDPNSPAAGYGNLKMSRRPDQSAKRRPVLAAEAGAPPPGRPTAVGEPPADGRPDGPDRPLPSGPPRSSGQRRHPAATVDGAPVQAGRPDLQYRPVPRVGDSADTSTNASTNASTLRAPPRRPLRPEPRPPLPPGQPLAGAVVPPDPAGPSAPTPPTAAPSPAAVEAPPDHSIAAYLASLSPAHPAVAPMVMTQPTAPPRRTWPTVLAVLAFLIALACVGAVIYMNLDWEGRNQERLKLEQYIELAETRLAAARDDLKTVVDRRNSVETDMSGLNEEREGLRSEVSRLRNRREDLIGEITALEAELGVNRDAKARADAAAAERARAEQIRAEAAALQTDQQQRILALEQRHAEALAAARQANDGEIAELRRRLSTARREARSAIAEVNKAKQAAAVGLPRSYGGDLRAFVVDRFTEKVTIIATQARLIIDYAQTVTALAQEYRGQNLPIPSDVLQRYFVDKDIVAQMLDATPTGAQIIESQLENREFAMLPQEDADRLRADIRRFLRNNANVFNAPLGVRVTATSTPLTLQRQVGLADVNYRKLLETLQLLRDAVRRG